MYAMSLVERLGFKTLQELYETLDGNEIMEWLAYDKCQNTDTRNKLMKELSLERQQYDTKEQEAEKVRQMFRGLGLK